MWWRRVGRATAAPVAVLLFSVSLSNSLVAEGCQCVRLADASHRSGVFCLRRVSMWVQGEDTDTTGAGAGLGEWGVVKGL